MVAIPTRHDTELTGRARVRAGWRGRLVLQVEVQTTAYSACPPMPGRDPKAWREQMRSQGVQTLHWRDAGWDDMQALHALDLVPAGRIEPAQAWPRRGSNVNPPPAYARPPAPPSPPAPIRCSSCTRGAAPAATSDDSEAMKLLERIERNPENMTRDTLLRQDVRRFLSGASGVDTSEGGRNG